MNITVDWKLVIAPPSLRMLLNGPAVGVDACSTPFSNFVLPRMVRLLPKGYSDPKLLSNVQLVISIEHSKTNSIP